MHARLRRHVPFHTAKSFPTSVQTPKEERGDGLERGAPERKAKICPAGIRHFQPIQQQRSPADIANTDFSMAMAADGPRQAGTSVR
jgi:hypothetical protein